MYVINSEGQLIEHPAQKGKVIRDDRDARTGHEYVKEIIERKKGEITYNYTDIDGEIGPKAGAF